MPKMLMKFKDQGKFHQTLVENLEDVAIALRLPEIVLLKFFSSDNGAMLNKNNWIKGDFTYDVMQKSLDKIIKEYVLCPKCQYPELKMTVEGGKKNQKLVSKCNACSNVCKTHDSMSAAGKAYITELNKNPKPVPVPPEPTIDSPRSEENKGKGKEKIKEPKEPKEAKEEALWKSDGVEKIISQIQALSSDDMKNNEIVMEILIQGKDKHNIEDSAIDHYILLCGLFPPSRNIVNKWKYNEELFAPD